jgi:cytochrome b subunit of formate dehydrogenase
MMSSEISDKSERMKRFSVYRIIEHLALIVLFVFLAATGLSQKFYTLGVSQSIILALGGIDSTRILHHFAAVLFTVLAFQHILVDCIGIIFEQWDTSMLISFKDAQDAVHNVRYYLGMADQPVRDSRYSYKEKFIYWLIFLGGIQQILTGFILWFPVATTKYLPGQFIPAAKAVHTNDAMLIFLLIGIWHIYDSMFSPEIFPLNKSIFTGYVEKKQAERAGDLGQDTD